MASELAESMHILQGDVATRNMCMLHGNAGCEAETSMTSELTKKDVGLEQVLIEAVRRGAYAAVVVQPGALCHVQRSPKQAQLRAHGPQRTQRGPGAALEFRPACTCTSPGCQLCQPCLSTL